MVKEPLALWATVDNWAMIIMIRHIDDDGSQFVLLDIRHSLEQALHQ